MKLIFQKKMASSSDDGETCYCSCSSEEELFNNGGGGGGVSTRVRKHRADCVYRGGRLSKDQFRILRMRERRRARRMERAATTTGRHQNASEDFNRALGDYVPNEIDLSHDLRSQMKNLKTKKELLTVGYGQGALKFRVEKVSKKALRGGVKIQESTVNLIEGRSNIPLDTPIIDLMTSLDLIFDKIISKAIKSSRNERDKLQIVVRTQHVKISPDDSGMKHPIRSEMISVGEWKSNENEKSRVLSKLFSKIEPYDFITLGDQIIIETILIKNKSDDVSDSEVDQTLAAGGRVKEGEKKRRKRKVVMQL